MNLQMTLCLIFLNYYTVEVAIYTFLEYFDTQLPYMITSLTDIFCTKETTFNTTNKTFAIILLN